LETHVGERGASLSGGQRQRLALARSLIAMPPVLLLDDCTSALDAQTEAHVREQIAQFNPYQTRIVVSHKLEAVCATDWLVVLDHGRIVRQGEPRKIFGSDLFVPPLPRFSVFSGPATVANR
jgi:ABC-type bacteriocin/lantibiotic exporter with double-glycine peptidase domain